MSVSVPMLDKEGKPYYIKGRLFTILKLFSINLAPRDLEEMRKKGRERVERVEKAKKNYERKYKVFMQKGEVISLPKIEGLNPKLKRYLEGLDRELGL